MEASTLTSMLALLVPFTGLKRIDLNYLNAKIFKFIVNSILGFDIHGKIVQGKEYLDLPYPAVYVANHQSTLDLMMMAFAMPRRTVFLVKKQLGLVPIMGQFMMAGKNVFLDRSNRESALNSMNTVRDRMVKENISVFIYPEGTRSHQTNKTLLPFKKGAFHLAKQGGFPIVPVIASTYFPIYDERTMKFEHGTFFIKVLPPIETKDTSVEDLIAKTHSVMSDALISMESVPSSIIKQD